MRVLSVGSMYPPHHRGGYELVWQGATRHLRDAGHDVRVLATDHREPGVSPQEDSDVHRDLRWWWHDDAWPERSRAECLEVERHNAAILEWHLEDLQPDVVAWWAMGGMTLSLVERVRRAGLPAVGFVHDDWLIYGPRVDAWLQRASGVRGMLTPSHGIPTAFEPGPAATWVFVSETTRRRALDEADLKLPRTAVAHSGIDHRWIGTATPAPPWRWRMLDAGRIEPRKGPQIAAAALDHLPREARLRLAGPGSTIELPNQKRLDIIGAVDRAHLPGVYAEADVVLFPVLWDEPWGLVPLEAMALGRPVIATGRGGSAEYLEHEENCLVVAPGDPEALAGAVRRLAGDEELRARIVAGGLRTAPRYTDDAFHARVEQELAAALSASSRG